MLEPNLRSGADRPCVEASGAEWGCGLWDAEIAVGISI